MTKQWLQRHSGYQFHLLTALIWDWGLFETSFYSALHIVNTTLPTVYIEDPYLLKDCHLNMPLQNLSHTLTLCVDYSSYICQCHLLDISKTWHIPTVCFFCQPHLAHWPGSILHELLTHCPELLLPQLVHKAHLPKRASCWYLCQFWVGANQILTF